MIPVSPERIPFDYTTFGVVKNGPQIEALDNPSWLQKAKTGIYNLANRIYELVAQSFRAMLSVLSQTKDTILSSRINIFVRKPDFVIEIAKIKEKIDQGEIKLEGGEKSSKAAWEDLESKYPDLKERVIAAKLAPEKKKTGESFDLAKETKRVTDEVEAALEIGLLSTYMQYLGLLANTHKE